MDEAVSLPFVPVKSRVQFGSVSLRHGVALAPLAGVSDRPFRQICRRFGAEYTVSEMVSAKALCYEARGGRHRNQASVQNDALASESSRDRMITAELATVYEDECPMAVQLFGSEPEFMAEAARMLEAGVCNRYGLGGGVMVPPSAIDVNMGCPVRKIVANGEGSALLRDPERAELLLRAVVRSTALPITVKIRIGWDEQQINAVEMAKRAEQAGVSMICVHGRTRSQMYRPGVDWSVIAEVKRAVSIPVFGNGDIFCAADALRMREQTQCDGVMIARGAMGNPWIFSEIIAAMEGRSYTPPSMEERFTVARMQVQELIRQKGPRVGLAESKKHLAWYCHGVRGASAARAQMMRATTYEEMEQAIEQWCMNASHATV